MELPLRLKPKPPAAEENEQKEASDKAKRWYQDMLCKSETKAIHVQLAAWAIYHALPNKPGVGPYKKIADLANIDQQERLLAHSRINKRKVKKMNRDWHDTRSRAYLSLKSNHFFETASNDEKKLLAKKLIGRVNLSYREELMRTYRVSRRIIERDYRHLCQVFSNDQLMVDAKKNGTEGALELVKIGQERERGDEFWPNMDEPGEENTTSGSPDELKAPEPTSLEKLREQALRSKLGVDL